MKTTQFFNLLTLSIPIKHNNKSLLKTAIVSSVYLDKLTITYDIFDRMRSLNLKKMILVQVSDNFGEFDVKELRDLTGEINLKIFLINSKRFFSYSAFEYFFETNKENNYEVVYAFHDKNWKDLCTLFALAGIELTGGSNSKKHLLSPHQYRLAQFLICLHGTETSDIIKESFHKSMTDGDKKLINYSTKSQQGLMIDFTKSQEHIKAQLLNNETLIPKSLQDFMELKNKENENNIENKATESEQQTTDSDPLDKFPKNSLSKTINQLDEERKNHQINIKSNHGARNFHTSTYQYNSNKLNDIIVVPQALDITNNLNKEIKNNKINKYFDSVKQIMEDVTGAGDDETKRQECQNNFENSWISFIEENLKDDKLFIQKYQSLLLSGIYSAQKTLDIMTENKYLIKKFPDFGNELNKIDFLILTFSMCISLYSRLSYNSLAIKLGEEILYLNFKNKYLSGNKINKAADTTIYSFNKYKSSLDLSNYLSLRLGDFFLTILQQYPHDIFVRKINQNSYYSKEPYSLELNKEYLEDIKNNLIINPNTLPMLCKPLKWSENSYGGYLSNKNRCNDIVTGSKDFAHTLESKESIYGTINYLNSIKFGINNSLLNYLLSSEGNYLLEAVKAEDELQRSITLQTADLYKNTYFYLNSHTDWRGRIYTQSFYLSYQGGDLSSSLLNFWDGEPISEVGKVYLYIYGANSHNENGISKCSYADRIKWVKDNYDKIINLDKDLILSAESPFIFTAFCLNMKEIHNNPNAIIKTPVFLDATCSGIQHLAALMKDLELAANTNLLPSTDSDKPGDIYSVLLEHINKKINQYGQNYPEFGILSAIKLTRKEIKTSVMTKVYNVTIYGISQQLQSIFKKVNETNNKGDTIKEAFEKEFHQDPINEIKDDLIESFKSNKSKTKFICLAHDGMKVELSQKDIYKIATIINDEIFVRFPALNNIYNYFMDITDITIKLGIPLTWITPSGLKITQKYLKRKQKVITVSIFGKSKKLVLRENDTKLNEAKQKQAIIPNIIHSLDASHLINIINTASKLNFYPIITIHDCFGTLPNKMNELDFMVRKEFILIYSKGEFLKDYHNRFLQSISDNQYEFDDKNNPTCIIFDSNVCLPIPSIPLLGDLDVENIKNSKYMIS